MRLPFLAALARDRQAFDAGQAHVQQDDIWLHHFEGENGLIRGGREHHDVAAGLEHLAGQFQTGGVVFNDQDFHVGFLELSPDNPEFKNQRAFMVVSP